MAPIVYAVLTRPIRYASFFCYRSLGWFSFSDSNTNNVEAKPIEPVVRALDRVEDRRIIPI